MEIITKRPSKERQRDAGSQQLPRPQLLDSPLPTPRRSCASADAPSSLRCRAGAASPLRTQVPFSWESSPGVPKTKSGRDARTAREEMPPPKPPPGRWGPPHPQCPASASRTNWCYTSEGSSDDCDASSFSDAIDRASSSPERIGSFDRVTSKRFEDIFLGRTESFAAKDDRSCQALAATDGAFVASSSRHSKHWRRRGSTRRDDDDDVDRQGVHGTVGQSQVVPRPRVDIAARVEQMAPRACGLMVFFPWSAKPAVSAFRSPSTRHAAPHHLGVTDRSRSHGRGNTTLRDALQVDNKTDDDIDVQDLPRREKRSRDELPGARRWGVSSLLDTSKRYCTDARKALSKLSIGLGADSGSPRLGRDSRSGKQDASMAAKLTKLKLTEIKVGSMAPR